jgi:hypothetical protein
VVTRSITNSNPVSPASPLTVTGIVTYDAIIAPASLFFVAGVIAYRNVVSATGVPRVTGVVTDGNVLTATGVFALTRIPIRPIRDVDPLFDGSVADRPGGIRGETGLDGIGADVVAGVGEEGLAVGISGSGAGDAVGGTGDHRESDHDTGDGLSTGGCNRGGEDMGLTYGIRG